MKTGEKFSTFRARARKNYINKCELDLSFHFIDESGRIKDENFS